MWFGVVGSQLISATCGWCSPGGDCSVVCVCVATGQLRHPGSSWYLNLLFPERIQLKIESSKKMSFVYTPSVFYHPFLHSFYPIFEQPQLQNQLTSFVLTSSQTQTFAPKTGEAFEPILIVSADTLSQTVATEKKSQAISKSKQISRSRVDKKDDNFGWRNQNKDRNVISSILKGYIHFILQRQGNPKWMERLSQTAQLQSGVSDFYKYMRSTFQTRRSYVGVRFIKQIICGNVEQGKLAHILSASLLHYLKEDYPLSIIRDGKIKKKAKTILLRRARTMVRDIFRKQ